MPIIQVLIFRGTGGVQNKNHSYYSEQALVRAGHVGVMGVIEDKIIGFHPTAEAAEAVGGETALIDALIKHEPQPGCLQDDDVYFERAYELVQETKGRTTVFTYSVEISDETLHDIQSWYNDKKEALYNFPKKDGQFEKWESNCAMFWVEWFRIPLPKRTGSIQLLTDYMRDEEYETWQPNES
ncbi:MAG: hypothetical protein Q9P44_21055 [Anaerolineae bacterium]|nr:hypothetical protein [Anaerolineae bacterium]